MKILAKACMVLIVGLTALLIRNIIVGNWMWALVDGLVIVINLNTIRMCKENPDA